MKNPAPRISFGEFLWIFLEICSSIIQFKAEAQTSLEILAKFILVLAKGEKNLVYTKWSDRGEGG